jgi:exodeoxyribonuclease VII large subunit
VLVWPVRVQGETSAAEVAAAIEGFNALPEDGPLPRPDLIIVARGGGSLEDLWSFNEEIVVRAAANSLLPLISAVGHETDVTLIDFAADKRAPTPTAAAELAVPVRGELLSSLASLGARMLGCWRRNMESRRRELAMLSRALPRDILAVPRQQFDALADRLPRALRANAQLHHTQYSRVAGRLSPRLLGSQIERRRERFAVLQHRLKTSLLANAQAHRARLARDGDRVTACGERARRAMRAVLARHAARVERAERLLAAFSYREVLKRGFALVRDHEGRPVRAATAVAGGMRLDIEFADGHVGAVADGEGRPQSAPRARPLRRGGGGQGSLFE